MLVLAVVVPLLIVVLGGAFIGTVWSFPRYYGPASDHFDGKRFHNQVDVKHGGVVDGIRWMRTRDPGPWRTWTDGPPGPRPPRGVGAGELRVTFVNHATVLLQMDGINMLTDPVWSERCSPVSWAGPKRVRPPGILLEDLPPIDLVLVSHNHYDHLDIPTLTWLADRDHPRIVVALGNRAFLERRGLPNVDEIDWWQTVAIHPGIRVTAVPAQHFSARGPWDRDRALWAGFTIVGAGGSVYFAGDTGLGPHFDQIKQRFAPIRLALLPIGAFRPAWFMSRVHLSPAEAVRVHQMLDAGTSVGIHFGTFNLADDGEDEAPAGLATALDRLEGAASRFWILGFGEGRDVPTLDADNAALQVATTTTLSSVAGFSSTEEEKRP